ncbi:MAG: hypothetical protein AAF363_07510 [Bacteroidota bacterium]
MIAFYAMGGGLGHLTRVQAFIHTHQIKDPFKVITANRSAFRFFSSQEVVWIEANESTTPIDLASKIQEATKDIRFEVLYIDTFPCGILGELNGNLIRAKRKHYLARRLIWRNYRSLISENISFDNTYQFEPLEPDHQLFIETYCNSIVSYSLDYKARDLDQKQLEKSLSKSIWLIVHSTQPEELQILVDHAQDIAKLERIKPKFIVISDVEIPLPDSTKLLPEENPVEWYPKADRIFTAGGFNTWYQLKAWRHKHTALPFPRKFDDQFWRIGQQ